MGKKVAIFGGGIAGLSSAHELVKRGFEVEIYEARAWYGGKARSIDVPNSATPGRKPLPGEHGFRFFPGFYEHLFDTLDDIPFAGGTVYDNLTATTEMLLARENDSELRLPAEFPDSIDEFERLFDAIFGGGIGIPPLETLRFAWRIFVFVTSCDERREHQWEKVPWYDFIHTDQNGQAFKAFLADGVTRSLVAMQSKEGSTRTIATIYIQMLKHLFQPQTVVDSLMNGPTNDVWLDPWVSHLQQQGVDLYLEAPLVELKSDGNRVTGAVVQHLGGTREIDADHYIAAIPVEVMQQLLTPQLLNAAPALGDLDKLKTAWMNGIQFYLDKDVKLSRGHGLFLDSEWALTSISQAQFWPDVDLSEYGDGTVDGILSICISDWETPGVLHPKPAKNCTADEIREEVWDQLKRHLNDDAVHELEDANVLHWFLDDSITFPNPSQVVNLEPLLINVADTLQYRPHADLGTPNFYVASDYIRTNTDLATMEAANEAAKRAVNAILDREAYFGKRCKIYKYQEWAFLSPLKTLDRIRYANGKPNVFDR